MVAGRLASVEVFVACGGNLELSNDLDLTVLPAFDPDRTLRGTDEGDRAANAEAEAIFLKCGAFYLPRLLCESANRKGSDDCDKKE